MKKTIAIAGLVIAVIILVWKLWKEPNAAMGRTPEPEAVAREEGRTHRAIAVVEQSDPLSEGDETQSEPDADLQTEMPEEQDEAREEALVEAFDALTDKWMEPSPKDISMSDIEAFSAQFSKVPTDRKQECLQRALNLVPDENAMLLMGVLLDKTQPHELVEQVFNDILNRDESVKGTMLRQIFKDKAHPCWSDAAWILEVTGADKDADKENLGE